MRPTVLLLLTTVSACQWAGVSRVCSEGLPIDVFVDADGDGYGATDSEALLWCQVNPNEGAPAGYSTDSSDCNDRDEAINTPIPYYRDEDGDGFGNKDESRDFCQDQHEEGYVADSSDCVDAVEGVGGVPGALIHEGADETCIPVDLNCDGLLYEGATDAEVLYRDSDGDGFGDPVDTEVGCASEYLDRVMNDLDCDDADGTIHPGAMETWYDGIDQDCDGANDFDQDADGFVPFQYAEYAGALIPGDCWDDPQRPLLAGLVQAAQVHPSAPERCDEVDWDCDGSSIPSHAEAAYFDRAPDQTRVYIAPATALDLPQEAEGVSVCGTNVVEPIHLSTDSPDFELVGLYEATVCPTPHEPVLTALGLAADLNISDITFGGPTCHTDPLGSSVLDLHASADNMTRNLIMDNVRFTALTQAESSTSPLAHIRRFRVVASNLVFDNLAAHTGFSLRNTQAQIDNLEASQNTMLTREAEGVASVLRLENGAAVTIHDFTTLNNHADGLKASVVYVQEDAEQFLLEQVDSAPPNTSCETASVPLNSGGDEQQAEAPNHEANDVTVVWSETGINLVGGSFADNTRTPVYLRGSGVGTPPLATITGATFTSNSGTIAGAVQSEDIDLQLTNNLFDNNWASQGGAISIASPDGASPLAMTATENAFCSNTATSRGGALALSLGGGIATFIDSELTYNQAEAIGGGIWMDQADLILDGTSLSANYAGTTGYHIYSRGSTQVMANQSIIESPSNHLGIGVLLGPGMTMDVQDSLWRNAVLPIRVEDVCAVPQPDSPVSFTCENGQCLATLGSMEQRECR